MGNVLSRSTELQEVKPDVKLQTQAVEPFSGNPVEWTTWKKKAKSALGTTGYSKILYDFSYAMDHPRANETVYHALLVACADGSAAHLIEQFDQLMDGHAAWQALIDWYDGEATTTETAADIRAALERLKFTDRTTASSFINKFRGYTKHLSDMKEGYTKAHELEQFLGKINHPDYETTVDILRQQHSNLEQCIKSIRQKERRLAQRNSQQRGQRPLQLTSRRTDDPNAGDKRKWAETDDPEASAIRLPTPVFREMSKTCPKCKKLIIDWNRQLRANKRQKTQADQEKSMDDQADVDSKNEISAEDDTQEVIEV
jgi:hypothetical protein